MIVWKTGHPIADTVANALAEGFHGQIKFTQDELPDERSSHIGYGILRGMGEKFKEADTRGDSFFLLDRGYLNPGHYEGYYRISHKGTQAKYDATFPISGKYEGDLAPKRKDDPNKITLICPPTQPVRDFYNYTGLDFDKPWKFDRYRVRIKGDSSPIDWDSIRAVDTFNSGVGWEAIIRGIPCRSHPQHSVVGSYYNTKSIDDTIEIFHNLPRKPLLDFMASHQFTLAEIRRGDACPLVNYYISGLDMTDGKRLQAK